MLFLARTMSIVVAVVVAVVGVLDGARASAQGASARKQTAGANKETRPRKAAGPKAAGKAVHSSKPIPLDVDAERARLLGPAGEGAVAAARALAERGDPRAREVLLDALATGLAPELAAIVLASIADWGNPAAFEVAAMYAKHRHVAVRAAAVRAIGAVDDLRAEAVVLAALADPAQPVRAAASAAVARQRLRVGTEPLLTLFQRGDEAAGQALAELGDPDLAKAVGELFGAVPNPHLAACLGAMLRGADFGPDTARLEIVRTLGRIGGDEATQELTMYVASVPERPARPSRQEAQAIIDAGRSGGK
jgi:HEAT repeat protein